MRRQDAPALCLVDELGNLLQVLSGIEDDRLSVVELQRGQRVRQVVQPLHGWSQKLEMKPQKKRIWSSHPIYINN